MIKLTRLALAEKIKAYDWEIGEYTYGVPQITIWKNNKRLVIGNYCSIASNVTIFLGGNHRPDWVTTYPFSAIDPSAHVEGLPSSKGDVVIGNDVWLGQGCMIMSGVT